MQYDDMMCKIVMPTLNVCELDLIKQTHVMQLIYSQLLDNYCKNATVELNTVFTIKALRLHSLLRDH